jgi:AcrR family transcriptional regulator
MSAAADVIAERGYEAATMAEIAARAGARIGSLYHFFPNKEVLADALIERYSKVLAAAFQKIEEQAGVVSTEELADTLVGFVVQLHPESRAIAALLETREGGSARRDELCADVLQRIARILKLRAPHLRAATAADVALVLLSNMKTMKTWSLEPENTFRPGALAELREMNRLYLEKKVSK